MAKTLVMVRCGRLVCVGLFSRCSPGDSPIARAQKKKVSTLARERLNARTSYEKLKRKIACNFDSGDLLVSLTFDDKYRPETRKQALSKARYFWYNLRKARRARGQPLKYIYVLEGFCPGGRPHIHAIINAAGDDLEEILSCWRYGISVEMKSLEFNRRHPYEELASYLTKEPREWGHPKLGEHTWMHSENLVEPEIIRETVPDYLTLTAPLEADIISKDGPVVNGYGEFAWLEYLLPYNCTLKSKKSKKRKKRTTKKE